MSNKLFQRDGMKAQKFVVLKSGIPLNSQNGLNNEKDFIHTMFVKWRP